MTRLTKPNGPWVFRTTGSVSSLTMTVRERVGKGVVVCLLDGNKMTTVDGVFKEFGRAFCFPDYYGENTAALEECISDLSWLPATCYVGLIYNANKVLAQEPNELEWLLSLLQQIGTEWSTAVEDGSDWDRPAIPFHFILTTTELPHGSESFLSQITELPASDI